MINDRARIAAERATEVERAFNAGGYEVVTESLGTRTAAEIIESRRAETFDVAVVGGGDGTIRASLAAFVGKPMPLGIVPLGTFNDLARTLAIPLQPAKAVEVILSGRRRPIDVGCVNGQYYLTEASLGISTHIARRQTPEVKRTLGVVSAVTVTATTVWHARPFRARVAYDGRVEDLRTIQLTVANSFHFGGLITNRTASLDDGQLELYSLQIEHWSDAFGLIKPILRQEVRDSSAITTRRADRFEIRTRRPRHIYADGEPVASTPATFAVLPRAITICVPAQDAPL